ncbi:DUF4192 family protein [Microbacterium sp. NPDC007973]|uniref:DUF4192 family protein n=1 Tax=Microbacterium sp. NPDC007973 TaxID=3364182 RepID=UPI0036E2856D
MTPTVVRTASSASFLALVPHLLECTPRHSLVVIPFADGRSLGAMRVDLPRGGPAEAESIASTVIGMACKVASTDAIVPVVYTDEAVTGDSGLPERALIDEVVSRAGICGLRVLDALVVGPDAWACYLDPAGAPPGLLSEISDAAARVPDGLPRTDQFSAAALPAVDAEAVKSVARLLGDVDDALGRPRDRRRLPLARRAQADEVVSLLTDPPALFERAVTATGGMRWPVTAALAFCLERPSLRDVALMQWAADAATGDAVLRAQTAFSAGTPFPEDLARPMWGEGERPDPERLRTALEVSRRVAAIVPLDRRPGPLSACSWLAWAQGRSSHAATYAEEALRIDSQHGLSTIMLSLLDAGRLPEWVFERPTSPAGRGSSRGSRAR